MATEQMKMPQLGESVTEGTISKWLVSPGDHVNKYDPIAEVMTDKVNAEVPSSFTGTITKLAAAEGDTLQVGEVFCEIEVEGSAQQSAKTEEAPAQDEAPEPDQTNVDQSQKKRYSPAVLRLADEHGIDLAAVQGTGAGGRITRKDLLKLIESGGAQETAAPVSDSAGQPEPAKPSQAKAAPSISSMPGDVELPVTPIRQAIAANMLRSKHEIPHAWTMMEVDVTNLVTRRNQLKDQFKAKEGFNLTFFAFFVKAVAQALKEFPEMNSMWAGDKIVQKKAINVSIAVATDDALFVPVIKDADEKTIKGIAKEIHELASKVRQGKLKQSDMEGGTFTVNNTGSFGSVQSMGIINYPQAAILQVESIVKRPMIVNGMIAARDMVNLCLSLDHRVLDGLVCGRFLQRIKQILEGIDEETSVY
ncbi:dihydrolipoamide acetyltransferase family protein [Bacillus sp. FSL R5-0820]|uniref:dihydrolipoamide acetyltransferase family protein n=1 Tax=Bacillus TaxID=1386 RepID=UPI000260AB4A|nr:MULTISPECIES: dihydrolipoamide acetyltransferase family protein [Bacillus]EIL86425.1 branched-chain alpha-keto acid dehydrogenase subunit E2 [Bacillus sp. M 2-6]KDE30859.1 branched-chain alpha-keto acid dehydrogenase subunit E2 [Bacillus altitudinis 41KF2b]MEC0471935.1 dihydrolipoamide acetyltransferase family protein [Bacillus altitudinis]MEC1043379.1 dihydrolipoamide acetyltransferase family protein [Bacillus altitudinis]MEC1090384.1 dihydrolipoamide acetyltransferase family protein [Baci